MGLTSAIKKSKLFRKTVKRMPCLLFSNKKKYVEKFAFLSKNLYRPLKQMYREMAGNISK